jgi:predicted Zn-dependent protease
VTRVAILFVTLAALSAAPAAAQPGASRILVMPFENPSHEARLQWVGEAACLLITDELDARGLSPVSRGDRVRAFEELHVPATASLSRATVIKVGQLLGAAEVIVGSVTLDGDNLRAEAHAIQIDVGRLEPEVSERAPLTAMFDLFERLAARLAPGSRLSRSPLSRPPIEAFENYIKGLLAENPATQAEFLENALRVQPGYDRAQLAMWDVRRDQGDHAAALAAARGVTDASPLYRRARFAAAVSLLELKRYDEAFDEFQKLLQGKGDPQWNAAILNDLGVIQLRRAAAPQAGTPAYFLTKATDADAGDTDYMFNLGYAYALERNYQGAIYWLKETVRRDPADADAHDLLAVALQATGSAVEAAREKDLARRLSATFADPEKGGTGDKAAVPRGLERVRTEPESPRDQRPEQAIVNSAQREQRDLAAFHLDRGRRLFDREEDREALVELQRAVYVSPYEAQAHLLIGRIHLRGGRLEEAVNALKISIWSEDTAAARIALADAYIKLRNIAAARTELERALVLAPESAEARRMLAGLPKVP